MAQQIVILLAVLFSVMTPIVFIALRQSVKIQRQEVIRDLELVFAPGDDVKTAPIPSFEFVKYKYYLQKDGRRPRDFSILSWMFSIVPLCTLMFSLNMIAICIAFHQAFGTVFSWNIGWLKSGAVIPTYGWVLVAAYCGAYLFMVRAFFTAINNFDLSPMSFVGAFVNLLAGILVSLIFIYGLLRILHMVPGWGAGTFNPAILGALVLSAFSAGYWPSIAIRNIIRASKLQDYKKTNIKLYDSFSAIPIEVVDGIDTEIRDRLTDFHIQAVQNLAAANPLMLFVETPYGIYQILDWVAQAQLCCSVGPHALLKLWQLGIRTIFDLERAAFDQSCMDDTVLFLIGSILFEGSEVNKTPLTQMTKSAVIANIRLRLNDSHIHRLRQLYNQIDDKLGMRAKRLPPILLCIKPVTGSCPFASA